MSGALPFAGYNAAVYSQNTGLNDLNASWSFQETAAASFPIYYPERRQLRQGIDTRHQK